jgi:hypothetical protein
VNQMLNPTTLAKFQQNVAALNNQAVFEIPEILAKLLGEPTRASQQTNSQRNDPVPAAR